MTITTFDGEARELDARTADGISVRLLWYPATETVTVEIFDWKRLAAREFSIESTAAIDAFHHPFAYAAVCDAARDAADWQIAA